MTRAALIKHSCSACEGEFTFQSKRKKCPNCGKLKLTVEAPLKKAKTAKSLSHPQTINIFTKEPIKFVSLDGEFKEDTAVMKKIPFVRTPRRDPVTINPIACNTCHRDFIPVIDSEVTCQRCLQKLAR
jgi:hypothetical protein